VRVPENLTLVEDPIILPAKSSRYALVHWGEDDPLRDVFLATFGAYPKANEIGRDYERFIEENIRPFHYWAKPADPLPAHVLDKITPSEISALNLNWDRVPCDTTMGFYAGRAGDFQDLVNYWNLRACDLRVLFLDPAHSQRLVSLRDAHSEFIRQRQKTGRHIENEIAVWSRSQEVVNQLAFPEALVPSYYSVEGTDVVRGSLHPPLQFLSERTVLASVSERFGRLALAFQFPEKPFTTEDEWEMERAAFCCIRPESIGRRGRREHILDTLCPST
jgi:hypothetical protein